MPLVLDTNIFRLLGEGEISVDGLLACRNAGISVHIADGSIVELLNQLSNGRFRWAAWLRARDQLTAVLDYEEPILLGGREGLWRAGIRAPVRPPVASDKIVEAVSSTSAWWRMFESAAGVEQMSHAVAEAGATISLKTEDLPVAVDTFKEEWTSGFERTISDDALVEAARQHLPKRGDAQAAARAVATEIAANLDALDPTACPVPSIRLDAMIRVYVLLGLRSLRRQDPYDPKRHRNDSFDHDLLRYLAYPAAICTADRRLIAYVKASGTWQAQWVVHPKQLIEQGVIRSLVAMHWPAL